MPIMLISLVSNIDPNDVVDPTGVDTHAHSVATYDSLKQAMCQGRRRKMESLLEVAAWKVCRKWQHGKSVGIGSMRSLSLQWQHMRILVHLTRRG